MYIYILCLVVFFINGVDLRHASRRDLHEGAAETARLIDFVQKVNNFEQRYPLNDDDEDTYGADRDDIDLFESMKLLQKNYDTARKFNEFGDPTNVQIVLNPEVIEEYKKLPEERPEVYDDSSDQAGTQRSYFQELSQLDRLEMHRLRSSNVNENGTVTNASSDIPKVINNVDRADESKNDNLDSKDRISDESSGVAHKSDFETSKEHKQDISDDSTGEKTKTNSKETKKGPLKSIETYNIVKPIIERMITERLKNSSLEKDFSTETDTREQIEISKEGTRKIEQKISKKHEEHSEENEKNGFKKNDVKNHSKRKGKKKKVITSSSSNERKTKKASSKIDSSDDDSNTKGKGFTNDPISSSSSNEKHDDDKPKKEDNKSEDTSNDSKNENKKKYVRQNSEESSSSDEKKGKSSEDITSEVKKSDKTDSIVEMDERKIHWSDYDEKKKSSEANSEANDGFYKRNGEINTESKWNTSGDHDNIGEKNISSKRKANDAFDGEDGNKDWKKKTWKKDDGGEDDWSTKKESNNKKDKWKDDDNYKKDSEDIKKDWKTKDDSWNKKNTDDRSKIDDDFNKKTEKRSKIDEDDDWDKSSWKSREEKKRKKKDKSDIDDDYTSKKTTKKRDKNLNVKRDNEWDNVGTDNKNSGWGNYDSFKNIKDTPAKVDVDNGGQDKKKAPKIEINFPKSMSWDRPQKRESYHDKPRNKGQRSPFRTPIPFVGQKAVYAD